MSVLQGVIVIELMATRLFYLPIPILPSYLYIIIILTILDKQAFIKMHTLERLTLMIKLNLFSSFLLSSFFSFLLLFSLLCQY